MANRVNILRDVYKRLDGMALSFGLPAYTDTMSDADVEKYMGMSLDDTLRELHLTDTDSIVPMSLAEYHIENRCIYHKLRIFRNTAAVFFKFSTSVDGKSVDKSMIPKMINEMIKEYDNEWKKWMSEGGLTGTTASQIWSRSSAEGSSWYRELNS